VTVVIAAAKRCNVITIDTEIAYLNEDMADRTVMLIDIIKLFTQDFTAC
jgi:hypothetical protein